MKRKYCSDRTVRQNALAVSSDNDPSNGLTAGGADHREIEKKLKEEFLRILAPMLGCTYDELKQRHRDYMFRRVIAGVSAAAVLAVGVTAFTLYQAAKTEAQYQEARRNQARYLAGIC